MMKVLHLPFGRQMIVMCDGLRKIGVDALSCHFRQRSVPQRPDHCLHLERMSASERKRTRRRFFEKAVKTYDIFHFHFGQTFFRDASDLPLLKKMGKKMVMQHRGSDVRMLSVARSFHNPWVRVKEGKKREEEEIRKRLRLLSKHIDHAIVADHELLSYIEPYYKHIHLLRQFIDLSQFDPLYPSVKTREPLVIHAPTHKYVKGTEFVLQAIEQLRRDGLSFKFQLIEKLTQEEAYRRYREADIIIDQLLQGSFGVVSLEAMALGKPVICYIRNDLIPTYPQPLPIVNANPRTVYEKLKTLITKPELRRSLGEQGRKYVVDHHNWIAQAKQLKEIYDKL